MPKTNSRIFMFESTRAWARVALIGIALMAAGLPAHAQTDKGTIRLLVGFPPGGSADVVARMLADKLRVSLGQNVVVDNKPGAAGRIAIAELKRSPADGTTLLVTPSGPFVVFPLVFKKLDYDPVGDFTPVARVATFDFAVAVGPKGPAGGVRELIAWIKANPTQANYGSPGAGTLPHFVGLMIGQAAGVELNHIAYKGGTPALTDLVAGQIPITIDTPLEPMELHRAGKIHIVATTGERRSPMLPEVPTLKESGVDMTADGFFAVYGPANLTAELTKKLNAAIVEAVGAADFREKMVQLGLNPAPSSPAELAATQAQHLRRWEVPVKASGFTAD
jgi:tripartite-type tricarboxylate transporter receptor subunit TctC